MTLPPRFILYRREWDASKKKWTKVPCDEQGRNINAHDLKHWRTYEERAEQATWDESRPKAPFGVGWVLNGDGYFLIDLDNCYQSAGWSAESTGIYQSFSGALGEVSTSGQGLHIIGKCDPQKVASLKNKWGGDKEFYFDKRFIALSKEGPTPIGFYDPEKDWTNQLLQLVPTRETFAQSVDVAPTCETFTEDKALITLALKSKNAVSSFGGGVTFRDLWEGNADALGKKYLANTKDAAFDHSSADAALMLHLAFWTAKNVAQMDRLFRQSALVRDKYTKRQDYRESLISNAIQLGRETYQPANIMRPEIEWPELPAFLTKLDRPAPPVLDVERYLPAALSQCLRNAASSKGAPVDYVFFGFLTVCASLVGNAVRISPSANWSEPCIIWTACIGAPSAGKSPALEAVISILREMEVPLQKQAQSELKSWELKKMGADAKLSAWKAQIKDAIKTEKLPPEMPADAAAPDKPHFPRLMISDTTIERLAMICAAQPKGLLSFRDELAGFIQNMERYSGGSSDKPFWLEAFGGRTYTVDRVNRDPVTIEALSISVLGTIQPDRLSSLLMTGDDDGFLARILPIWPEPVLIERFEGKVDNEAMRYAMTAFLELECLCDANGNETPFKVSFSDEAKNSFIEFRKSIRLYENRATAKLISFSGKMPGYCARLSLIFELLDWALDANKKPLPKVASDRSVHRAIHLVERYLLPMAERTYSGAPQNEFEVKRSKLIEVLRIHQPEQITAREIMRMGKSQFPNKASLAPLLENLVEIGILAATGAPTSSNGGRPSIPYKINPRLRP
ncbi:DUF3987 domain-containing protein [uncultured Tateyamaria sp.]|uniref:phage NrS-1 polymerase family protein n=1 Tax=uncultured Tateyamaria sp. TaxID=455651 RepID=UPI00262E88AE|nr:DUF3987 domain-containing protein [uncultured Tateyamaria sp.]